MGARHWMVLSGLGMHRRGTSGPFGGTCLLIFISNIDRFWQVLKWAHENGGILNSHAWDNAAENGHLEVLKYLHAKKCPTALAHARSSLAPAD